MIHLQLLAVFEEYKPDLVEAFFSRIAFMTRYGGIGYREAVGLSSWEATHFMDAVGKLLREQNEASGGIPGVYDR